MVKLKHNVFSMGFLFLWNLEFQDSVEATAEVSKTFNEKIKKYCDVTLMSLAYAGTGNVLQALKLSFAILLVIM